MQKKDSVDVLWRGVIRGDPRTKKNSQQIFQNGTRRRIVPSKAYAAYEQDALWQLKTLRPAEPISEPVNVCAVYYMAARRRVDLLNLLEATDDILVRAGVLLDDHCGIVAGHDGSRVSYDRENPRVEVDIVRVGKRYGRGNKNAAEGRKSRSEERKRKQRRLNYAARRAV